ncbi:amino acid adenylation domain-containing protein [Streptomyces sp. NPDC017448]|uniref:amino acid adenylation domain-containing protein n=1 Tax=Streptomyces sp. NPDC017448 TaxID=3364996 RepID=UPI00378A56A7
MAEPAGIPCTLSALVDRQTGLTPAAPAVRVGDLSLTYAELDAGAKRLAGRLVAAGVGPGDVVGVHTGRGLPLLVAVLGALKAGAAFLALPRGLPRARLTGQVEDARATAVVTVPELRPGLTGLPCPVLLVDGPDPDGASADGQGPALAAPDPRSAAYILYTSGSTGTPKGVVVEHRAAAEHVLAMADRIGVRAGDGVLQMAGEAFDVAVEQIFTALATGATVVLRGDEPWGPAELRAELARGPVTVADLPTALFAELAGGPDARELPSVFAGVRTVLVGGEALAPAALSRWRAAFAAVGGGPGVINAYGPTESVMTALTSADLAGGGASGAVPVGTVVGPRTALLLDAGLAPARPGAEGELYVGGTALARGYLGRPDLTAERFVPDPFGAPGARMYRTGDRMTAAPDGELTFLGRVDNQLKVRGFRIEPGEVEAALAAHPAIGQAAVAAHGDRLVGYLVSAEPGSRLPVAAIRDWLGDRLPQWMVPAAWTWLDRLPVTSGGKIDRSALPPVETDRADAGSRYEAARDEVQSTLCAVWSRVLNVPEVGIHDDFFELGGTSLLAARALADIRTELAADLPLSALFASPTPLGLSAALDARADGAPVLPPVTPRARPTGADGESGTVTAPISLMQRQVWVVEQLSADSSAYNAPTTLRLHGPLDLALLERTLGEIVRRHEIFRTTVELRDGEPVQVIHPPYPVRVPLVDLRSETDPEAAAEEVVRADIGERFDIGRLPLIRWTALRLAEQSYELVLVEHHLVHDGWSFALLVKELGQIYTALAEGGELPPDPAVQYRDFAHWQHEAVNGPAMRAQSAYWRDQLSGAPAALELAHDGARSPHDDTRGSVHRVELPAALCERLRAFSRESGVTLFITMLAGYAALLHRYSGQDEVCVGSAFGNRGVPGTADVIGMFVNPVALRCPVRPPGGGGASFTDLVERTRAVVLAAQANQELPFVELVRELDPPRTPGRNPVFQAMLNFDDSPLPELRLGPVAGSYLERNNGTAKLDLSVLVVPRAERQLGTDRAERDRRITLIWEYRTDLFDPNTVEALARGYQELLEAALGSPDGPVTELPAGRPATPAALPEPLDAPPADVVELFAGAVARNPGATAVTLPSGGSLTYRELDRRSHQVARMLVARGIGAGDLVALRLPRSPDLVVAVLGVLKAGAAYLPLDAGSPAARIADILADARPRLLIGPAASDPSCRPPGTGEREEEDAVDQVAMDSPEITAAPDDDPGIRPDPAELAYVIYTSGSTGRPKGVAVAHRGLADKYRAWQRAYRLDETEAEPAGHLQMASPAFDVCTGDIFRALLSGGRLVLCPAETLLEPDRLLALLRDERIAYAEFLPSVLRLLADHAERTGQRLPRARLFAVGGEAWSGADLRRFRAVLPESTRLLNVYGVTEATVGSTFHQPTGDERGVLPVGGPLPGVRAVVLDGAGRPAAPGMAGEIFLGGTGLARGYHADPARTASRFVPDPDPGHPGERLYATGDRARMRRDGVIEYLGRRDHQVKIRGFRVEPAEVEEALRACPSVAEAVVVARTGPEGNRLVAYCTPPPAEEAPPLTVDTARDWLRERLPGYLVPAAFTVLAELPRTTSGKADRNALPEPRPTGSGTEASRTAPRDGTERAVAAVWQRVLDVAEIGVHDDFFDLGGHSLLAVRLVAALRAELGLDLTVRDLIVWATVEAVAAKAGRAGAADAVPLAPRTRTRIDPALLDHEEPV